MYLHDKSKITSSLTAIQRPGHRADNFKMIYRKRKLAHISASLSVWTVPAALLYKFDRSLTAMGPSEKTLITQITWALKEENIK